jgi:acetylornithine deacetylase/succinyl-diaminopimelate desuccinylase-like protein
MTPTQHTIARLRPFIRRDRLVETAVALIGVPSRTGEAGEVSDRLAAILEADGFTVERPTGGYDAAPAVAVRFDTGRPGPTVQFNGHLDTVHLPFVPPAIDGDHITGSGASDMKSGIAAAVEALRALRDSGALPGGSILLTAHDLHESPWGDGRQLDAMIRDGLVGDAVLLPEPLHDPLPVVGRGLAVWKVTIHRPGAPVHEVMRPLDEPNVITASACLIAELDHLRATLAAEAATTLAGYEHQPGNPSVFVGQVHAGEIFNQHPQVARLEGTRRWLPGTDRHKVESEFRAILKQVADKTRTLIDCEWFFTRDAFFLDRNDPFVTAFQQNYAAVAGAPLALGTKPFVDDGNSFCALGGVPAITHGPKAGGQHTLNEWVSIDDLVRIALLYAATAVSYCATLKDQTA